MLRREVEQPQVRGRRRQVFVRLEADRLRAVARPVGALGQDGLVGVARDVGGVVEERPRGVLVLSACGVGR